MKITKSLFAGVLLTGIFFGGVVNAATVLVDFTDENVLGAVTAGTMSGGTYQSQFSVDGIDFTATSNVTLKKGDGLSSTSWFCGTEGLECDLDGLGAGSNSDEFDVRSMVLGSGEFVEFTIDDIDGDPGTTVDLIGFLVLDMFKTDANSGPATTESVALTANDNNAGEYFSDQTNFGSPGFNAFVYGGMFNSQAVGSFGPVLDVSKIRFDPGTGNDGRGYPDFALAGLLFETRGPGGDPNTVVPIPAAAWLFASALAVFGYLGKRRSKT